MKLAFLKSLLELFLPRNKKLVIEGKKMIKNALRAGAYLHHLEIESENPGALAQFYSLAMDMKLEEISENNWLCCGTDRKILITKGESNKLSYAAFACHDIDGLNNIRNRAQGAELEILESKSRFLKAGAFAVSDPDENIICFGLATPDKTVSKKLHAPLQHLTFASKNVENMVEFYEGKLGFFLSDRVLHENGDLATAFMTSNHEHHTIACFKANYNGIDHHSYEAGNWMYIRDWCDHFSELDIQLIWGPGRHGPGNNLFVFIEDLDKNWIEISAELETVIDRETNDWPQSPRTLNKWGKAIMRS